MVVFSLQVALLFNSFSPIEEEAPNLQELAEGASSIMRFANRVLQRPNKHDFVKGGAHVVTEDIANGNVLSTWNAFLTNDLHFIIEAPKMLVPSSRDTLNLLLDTAEELGCHRAYVCIDRKEE